MPTKLHYSAQPEASASISPAPEAAEGTPSTVEPVPFDQVAQYVTESANPENVRKWVAWSESPPDPALLDEVLAILRPIHNWFYLEGRPENNDPRPEGA